MSLCRCVCGTLRDIEWSDGRKDAWGPLGTAGDHRGPSGTTGVRGNRGDRGFVRCRFPPFDQTPPWEEVKRCMKGDRDFSKEDMVHFVQNPQLKLMQTCTSAAMTVRRVLEHSLIPALPPSSSQMSLERKSSSRHSGRPPSA